MSRIFSIVLFCMLAKVKTPLAASLAGVRMQNHEEEEILHLSPGSRPYLTDSTRNAERRSYDTSIYTPSLRDTAPAQEEWLPKLSFDTPTERNHPARRSSWNNLQPLRHKESDLLPSPAILRCPEGFSHLQNTRGQPPFLRSITIPTATSSIYSQSTVADSTFSKHARTMSSFSDDSSIYPSLKSPPPLGRTPSCKPSVPSIPEHYLSPSATDDAQIAGRPMRPRSRPRMVGFR